MRQNAKKRKGFSLVEILVVMGIMAVVAGTGIMIFGSETDRAKFMSAEKELDVLQQAFLQYYNIVGSYEGVTGGDLDSAFSETALSKVKGTPKPTELFESFLSKTLTDMKPNEATVGTYAIYVNDPDTTSGTVFVFVKAADGMPSTTINTQVVRTNDFAENRPMVRYIKRGY